VLAHQVFRRRHFLGLLVLNLGTAMGDNGDGRGSKSRLQQRAAWRRGQGTFSYKDYRIKGPGRYKTITLKPDEFIRRFLMHVLPNGFHRIRHYGLLASGTKAATIVRARELIAAAAPAQTAHQPQPPDSAAATDKPTYPCPCCGGRMNIIETFKRGATPQYRPPPPTAIRIDTS
jgi:hypothetical protein